MPDAISAGLYLFAWLAPLVVDALVRNLALAMMVEFVLIHAAGFYSLFILTGEGNRRQGLIWLSVLCLLFVATWSLIFGEWWPLLIFAWLAFGKLHWLRLRPGERDGKLLYAMVAWGVSSAIFVLAVVAGLALPLPYLGITPEVVPLLDMPGEGEWLERPQSVMAAGASYFLLVALAKFKGLINAWP